MSCCLSFGCKRENMGSCFGSEFLRMIFIIIFCLLLLLQRTHIFTGEAEAGNFHIHGLPAMYFTEENVRENENQLKRISGQDENEDKEALIVEKFRALLGLKSFYHGRHFNGYSEHVSPSPSSLPSIPPAPAPALHVHHHHHHRHPLHPSHWDPPSHNIHNEHRSRAKRILVAVFLSVGVAAVILICAVGLILVFRKFRNHRKRAKRTMPPYSKKKRQKGKNQNSSSKVSMNSGLDLFYLDSLGEDIEQHTCPLKQTPGAVDTTPDHCVSTPIYEREEIKQELITPELNNSGSCSTKEILSVHEDVESMKYESDDGDKVIIPMEDDSSDNESFHSVVDSHSSNVGLSNASAVSLGESISSLSSPTPASQPNPSSMANSTDTKPITLTSSVPCSSDYSISKQQEEKIETCIKHPQTFMPPPPPTSQMPLFQLHFLCSSSGIASQSPRSPTLHNLSSPSYSDSNSKSNRPGQTESPSPSQPSPSKSPSSIPPPPCPPPFKVNNNNGKSPPPPPSQLPQFTPIGKDGAPLPKLKPLHWDKVRAAPDRSMVWDKLRTSSFELDEEMMESLFGYNLQNSMKNEETKSKTPSPGKHVLEPKRLQNITILSKALNVTAEQVCEALIQGKGLSLQQLEALVKMVPNKEEEAKLSTYKGDINELGSAEKFVIAMLGVPFAFQRVEVMLYKETFEDEVFHLRNSFSMLEEACKELRSSRLFLKLLEAVLKTGNRMNVGTIRGGAIAFKLDTLLKLADVKGTDGKTTLLHFVVQEIVRSEGIKVSDSIMGKINQKSKKRTEEEKEEDYIRMGLELVSGLSTELYNVKKTATIDLDVLASSVSNLSDGMAKLQHLVQKELSTDENSENFVNSMKSFLNYAERNLVELQGEEDRVFTRVKEITEYFHGDVSKEDANPLRIFVIVRDFLGMLDNVCRELRRSKVPRTPNPLAPFR